LTDNLHFGKDNRFKMDPMQAFVPGPGAYTNDNNWTRRTYNLKFLNFNGVKGNEMETNENISHTQRSRSRNNTIEVGNSGNEIGMSIKNNKQQF
jgi:hypothetical protein